jgi:hypothetical protein
MIYYVFYKRTNCSPSSIRVNRATADRAIEHVEKHWLAGESDAKILYALPASEVCPDCEHPLSYHGGHGCTFKFLGVLGGDVVESLCQCQRKGKREG